MIVSDPDLTIFRGFKYGHARILSQMQIEITEVEKELFKLDTSDATNPITESRLRTTGFEKGGDTTQTDLIHKLHLKILEYGI
jgi:hypothetical protein